MDNQTPSVVGTWALVEAWDIGDDPSDPTKKTYPWGNPPAGYWVFDGPDFLNVGTPGQYLRRLQRLT